MVGKRTATSETFRLPDGQLETRIYQTPIHYRDSEGDWAPIEESLQPGAGAAVANGDNRFDLQLPSRLDAGAVRLTRGDDWISYRLVGPTTSSVDVDRNTASYEAPQAETTFEFTSLANGLKEEIVLEDPSAPNSFDYALEVSDGIVPTLEADGSIKFRDAAEKVVAVLPAPVMQDSAPVLPAFSDAVDYELSSREDGSWDLKVKADPDWLAQPERVGPVTIDPTVKIPSPFNSCNLYNGASETYSLCAASGTTAMPAFALYDYPGGPGGSIIDQYGRSAVVFNLAAIPTNAYVTGATVGLHAPEAAQSTSGVELRGLTETWGGYGASWKNAWCTSYPSNCTKWSVGGGGDFSAPLSEVLTSHRGSQAGWWEFSDGLTATVQDWVANPNTNYGLLVKLRDEQQHECPGGTCLQRMLAFDTGAVADTSKRPYIKVTYYPAAPATQKLVSPTDGTRTPRRLKLKSAWASGSGVTGITYQWKSGLPGAGTWKTIPHSLVKDAKGQSVSWPIAVSGGKEGEAVYFDARSVGQHQELWGGKIYVRAIFEALGGAGEGYSAPVSAEINLADGNVRDASAQVGPGTLDLATGAFTISATDASIPALGSTLEFARTNNAREAPKATGPGSNQGVLGLGWEPSIPVEGSGGSVWRNIREVSEPEEGSYMLLTNIEGDEIPFEITPEGFKIPVEAPGWELSSAGTNLLALSDPSGTRTVFEKNSYNAEYLPVSVSFPGGENNKTTMVYKLVNGERRLEMLIGPTPVGLSVPCNATTAKTTLGCRSLQFTYQAATTWGAPSSYKDRLAKITYYGPDGGSMGAWDVAQYSFDTSGRLIEEWDPRVTPALKTTYEYLGGQGLVTSITPPGQKPWLMEYSPTHISKHGEDLDAVNRGRLLSVSRASLLSSPSTATTTIAYEVPVSGSGAPYDMSGGEVAKWGQQNLPTDATAIFPPDEVPASSPPGSYDRATVYYMNVEGQLVNTATPAGAGTSAASITTVEPDEHGNILRELTAQNRLRSVAAGSGSVAKSHELDTHRTFSEDGTEMLEEWGPLHEVRLESGATEEARLHRVVQYENPAPPAGAPAYHLPTRETTGASIKNQGIDSDQRVTETVYDWALRKPKETIVDPNGLEIRRYTSYDSATGMPTEIRQPKGPEGGDAHTTQIHYYRADASGPAACQSQAAKAGLPCEVKPAKQPETAGQPEIPVKKFVSFSPMAQPTEIVETVGGQHLRTSYAEYDGLGRKTVSWQHGSAGNGKSLSPVQTLYNSATGMPESQRFHCPWANECETGSQEIIMEYDELGRLTAYEDADGSFSSMTYDLLGRPVTSFDGKGTQTRKYDSITGLLVKLEDSAAGTFTASYDADGNLIERTLPNGLIAKTTFDEAGEASRLTYTKTTNCGTSCTWLDFTASRSIYGQVNAQSSTLSSQQYSYDKAGRLEVVKDTPQGGSCTTRKYTYDEDSNRTELVTRAPGIGGVCDTSSSGSKQNYSYDAADRLIGSGIVYDGAGRITSLPAQYAGGGALYTDYYTNDLVAAQTQGGVTNSYELDSALRPRLREQNGGSEETEIFHYAGGSDSPAWTERDGEEWTRSIAGIGGELTAIDDSEAGTILQLTNLHGDVVATADPSSSATSLLDTFEFDEFGNPQQAEGLRYGWLGGKTRRTELSSGVVQMGVRSYVPAMGRFTSVDPVFGGSASTYDYANADPVNNFDLNGEKATGLGRVRMAVGGRIVRVGTSSAVQSAPATATASSSTIGSVLRAIKKAMGIIAPIAWGTCIPSYEMSVKVSVLTKVFGNACIPKLGYDISNIYQVQAAKVLGASWYIAINGYLKTGTPLSGLVAGVIAGAFCGGNDGERAWAYVNVY